MNFLFYFFNFYYTIAFKYLCFCFIFLFVTLFYFYKQIDYYFLIKITYLTKVTDFKYIDIFDIFVCTFKINFIILFFFFIPILYNYFVLYRFICSSKKKNKIIKFMTVFWLFLYTFFFGVYINYICIAFFKILLSYQISVDNMSSTNFFLKFDLYLANYVNFWSVLNVLFYCLFLFILLHCVGCSFNSIYYYFNKLFWICGVIFHIGFICNSLLVDIYAFSLFLVYFSSFYIVLFFLYQIYTYKCLYYK